MMAPTMTAAAISVDLSAPSPRDRILAAIRAFAREYGHSPTVRDIADATGITSTASVHYHLLVMERDGLITRCRCGCARPVAA